MKNMKKLFSLALALVMMMALVVTAGAASTDPAPGESTPVATPPTTGSITITNAAKGETYKIFKLFDATVKAGGVTGDKGITYTYSGTTLPNSEEGADPAWDLGDYFEIITTGEGVGQVRMKGNATTLTDDAVNALKAWAATQTASPENIKIAEGGDVVFSDIALGYYVVTSTVDSGAAISVNSTRPNVSIVDKNSFGTPTWPEDGKTADKTNAQIGETVTYTVKLDTVNWSGTGADAKQVTKYVITDNATGLRNMQVTSIKIVKGDTQEVDYKVNGGVPQFVNNKIEFPWVDESGNSLYENGSQIVITYTAVVDAATATNTVSATYDTTSDNGVEVPNNPSANVYNTVIGTNKHNSDGNPLADAKFKLYRVNAETNANEYYKMVTDQNGKQTVTWVAENQADEFTTGNNGAITGFNGLAVGTYYLVETEAPNGYNKLGDPITVSVEEVKHDVNDPNKVTGLAVKVEGEVVNEGNVDVLNNSGTELPSTGGIGTTIFYVVGGVLMVGAAVLFLTKKRSEV